MTPVQYPWPWLADGVGATFLLRYPWMDTARRAARAKERVCLLLPEAAGSLADWSEWLTELIGRDHAAIFGELAINKLRSEPNSV